MKNAIVGALLVCACSGEEAESPRAEAPPVSCLDRGPALARELGIRDTALVAISQGESRTTFSWSGRAEDVGALERAALERDADRNLEPSHVEGGRVAL